MKGPKRPWGLVRIAESATALRRSMTTMPGVTVRG